MVTIDEPHQIGNFADFCNDCGNCDVFCPEDGGPYVLKPRFFGSREEWQGSPLLDGFFLGRTADSEIVLGRFTGEPYEVSVTGGTATYSGRGFDLTFDLSDPIHTLRGSAEVTVDLTWFEIMNALRLAILSRDDVNYVNSLL
jgi:putative selenate reductase